MHNLGLCRPGRTEKLPPPIFDFFFTLSNESMTVPALALYNKTKCILKIKIRISKVPEFLSRKSDVDHTA